MGILFFMTNPNTNFTHLAGREDKSIAGQIHFISKYVWQLLEVFASRLSQPQQVIVYGHSRNSLDNRIEMGREGVVTGFVQN